MTEEFKAYIKKLTDAQLYSLLWICKNYVRNEEYTTAVIDEMDRRKQNAEV